MKTPTILMKTETGAATMSMSMAAMMRTTMRTTIHLSLIHIWKNHRQRGKEYPYSRNNDRGGSDY